MNLATATLILAFFAACAALATAWTAFETKRLRKDSQCPLLVPIGGGEGIRPLHPSSVDWSDTAKERWLHVHNIGLGPAVNIAIRLELRPKGSQGKSQFDEMLNEVRPLPAGSEGLVLQWKSAEKPIEIYDDHWIVITYSDAFGRHFQTEARRVKESDSWLSIKTKKIPKLPPRARDVDYYASAFGRMG